MIDEDYYMTDKKGRYNALGEIQFMKDFDGNFEGFHVTVDEENKDIPMIIQQHTNPLNKNKHDMKAKYLDSTGNFMHIGNVIAIPQKDKSYKNYMAITEPSSNGIYSEYKILPLTDDVRFGDNSNLKCIIADKGVYDEISYINEQNVFEDKDLRAIIIQYNQHTKALRLFDDVYVNNENYRVVKIDDYTFKEYDEPFGVMQFVLISTPFGDIEVNDTIIRGIVMTARVKDKILNSISRELLCDHNKVRRGDYIDFTYDRDKLGTMKTETYLTVNNPTMGDKYDVSLMYLCERIVNVLNDKGEVVSMPLYYENNRARIDKITENEYISLKNSSYMIMMQDNDLSEKLKFKTNRIIVNKKAYKITGFDDFSTGILALGLEIDQITPDDNVELGVANYYSQMDEINGSNPTPQGEIKGDDELYLGYANEYVLEMPNVCTWSVDNPNVMLTDLGGNKCELLCESTKELNKTFVLTATLGEVKFTKEIKIVSI